MYDTGAVCLGSELLVLLLTPGQTELSSFTLPEREPENHGKSEQRQQWQKGLCQTDVCIQSPTGIVSRIDSSFFLSSS